MTKEERLEKQRQFTPDNLCFPEQAALVREIADPNGPRHIVGLWGRQTGKSHGSQMGALLLALAKSSSDCAIVVITSTSDSIKRMAWTPAKRMRDDYCLPVRPLQRPPTMTTNNGCMIYYLGADGDDTIKRLRGIPNLIAVIIDECGTYDSDKLKEIEQTVTPGLRPRAGKIVFLGTPSLQGNQGRWYEITQNPAYSQHRAFYYNNNKVPSASYVEKLIDDELAALFPWLTPEQRRQTAYFKREYMCEFVVDLEEKVYKMTDANLVDYIPPCKYHATGGDLGITDEDALITLGWNDESMDVYVVFEKAVSGQDTLAFGQMALENNEKYRPLAIPTDAGGLGAKVIETVKIMYPDIPIEAAVKPPIPLQVRAVNNLLIPGRLKMLRGSRTAMEMSRPTWPDGKIGDKIDENGPHSNLLPALRYVIIKITPWLPVTKPLTSLPNPHSTAYVNKLMDEQNERERSELASEEQRGEEYIPSDDDTGGYEYN
jgi:hypothetical protein